MHQIIEPPGVRRATRILFVLFAAAGLFAAVVVVGSGESLFGLLFGLMFIGVPWIIHRASAGPGIPGFTVSTDGILGAADDEQRLLPWGEVDRLAWHPTGLSINDVPCLALHAELLDGRSIRVTTYTARRGREVDEVEQQLRASGVIPTGTAFEDRDLPSDAKVPPVQVGNTPNNFSDLPAGTKVVVTIILAAFFLPFLAVFAIIPMVLAAFSVALGWVAAAVLLAMVTVVALRVIRRLRQPVLACSFTVEGIVVDNSDGLTVPWSTGSRVRIDPAAPEASTGRTARAWMVHLERPGGELLRLSPPLASTTDVRRVLRELLTTRKLGMIPGPVELVLAPDLPRELTEQATSDWVADR